MYMYILYIYIYIYTYINNNTIQIFITSKLFKQPRVAFKKIEKSSVVFKKAKNAKSIS